MKKLITGWLLLLATITGCNRTPQFRIEGTITEAPDSVLYLEHLALDGLQVLDSVRLDAQGRFAFNQPRPANPEFYRLRIANHLINLSIDSTETIGVKAAFPNMNTHYEISGSASCQRIKELTLMLLRLRQNITAVSENRTLTVADRKEQMNAMVDNYKNKVKRDYILKDPASASAYFALFQSVGNTLIFNPVDDWNDVRFFAAVGTAWETRYPGTPRTEYLHNLSMQGMEISKPRPAGGLRIDSSKVQFTGIIDLALMDLKGRTRRLTDLKGKVVLLDFTAYSMPGSSERIMNMRQLYDKYSARGLEIYQVGVDPDEHYWKTACDELPWICVYAPGGASAEAIRLYGVEELPTYFLIDRNNDLNARSQQVAHLENALEQLLSTPATATQKEEKN